MTCGGSMHIIEKNANESRNFKEKGFIKMDLY
jgi:hypothetical protein